MNAEGGRGRRDSSGGAGRVTVSILAAMLLVRSADLAAQAGDASAPVNFHGTIEEGGAPVTGARDVTLRVYDAASGGTVLCTTAGPGTTVTDGRFQVPLARTCLEPLRTHADVWVEVQVGATIMPQRVWIGSASLPGGGGPSTPRPQPGGTGLRPGSGGGSRTVAGAIEATAQPVDCPRLVAYGGSERAYHREETDTEVVRCSFGNDSMIKVGSYWIDQYEAALVAQSFWNEGACDGAGVPYGSAGGSNPVDDYPAEIVQVDSTWATPYDRPGDQVEQPPVGGFPDDGNWSVPVFACSIAGVVPSRMMTWFQAQQACLLAGKRLCTSSEWHAAAAGVADPGENDGTTNSRCHTHVAVPRPTGNAGSDPGSNSSCVSGWGVDDLRGNLWEWVADWVPPTSALALLERTPSADAWRSLWGPRLVDEGSATALGGRVIWVAALPVAPLRSGYWSYGTYAGAISLAYQEASPYADTDIGVRCCTGVP
ncbi:MAG: SUMF1/EgtB/PvdO family nonheme iron enzyme [Deltaproteobacteria bacterium]|nr:SUMF1/EgtB/PvdO family nonheme iron enzyme [Deltaproteobacteria bacterium]